MTLPAIDLPRETLTIRPWADPVIDRVGHDPRSSYVEQFWLAILGPSTTWLLRRLAAGLEAQPQGFALHLDETARALGVGHRTGRHSPFARALLRCCQFGLARAESTEALAVRRKLPPLTRNQAARLPEPMQQAHQQWLEQELRVPTEARERRRARHLALSLLELGEDVETTERTLQRWRYRPAIAREATAWAFERHRRALAAAEPTGDAEPRGAAMTIDAAALDTARRQSTLPPKHTPSGGDAA
jgi:hypothetical protein